MLNAPAGVRQTKAMALNDVVNATNGVDPT